MTAREVPTPLEAARKLVPMIRSCAETIEAQRELPRPPHPCIAHGISLSIEVDVRRSVRHGADPQKDVLTLSLKILD